MGFEGELDLMISGPDPKLQIWISSAKPRQPSPAMISTISESPLRHRCICRTIDQSITSSLCP
jgi:hypothetical protein